MTWGNAHYGGDSSAVRDQAYPSSEWQQRHEQWQIANSFLCCHLEDGSAVALGNADFGGDSSAVQDQLKGVQQIQAYPSSEWQQRHEQWQIASSFLCCHLKDGSVVALGNADFGGDSSAVQDQLKGVQQIQAYPSSEWQQRHEQWQIASSFLCCHLKDGSIVALGNADFGGDSSAVQDQLKGVQQIQAYPSSEWQQRHEQWQIASSFLCCHSGRWIRRCLGQCRLWW